MDWTILAIGILALAFIAFARARILTYLHYFQQEEYNAERFLHWLIAKRAFDRRASAAVFISAMLSLIPALPEWRFSLGAIVAALALSVLAFREADPRKHGKKRLVMTTRASRIFWTSMILIGLLVLLFLFVGPPLLAWILALQALPLIIVLGNLLLQPYENSVQRRLLEEAHAKLLKLQPTVIGITGSFGKTSVKHILGHLLESQAATLVTPGSVNTPMGITRIIREQLGPQHRFFICEMGAYGPGSIERLCKLAPPNFGIITAIGHAHYERFQSLDVVAKTKFELAEAVVTRNGKIVIAADVLEHAAARAFQDRHSGNVVVVGEGDSAMRVMNARQEKKGIVFEANWQGKLYTIHAPLFGLHHCGNIALAFVTACVLGCKPEDMVAALATVPQIKHRLEVSKSPAGWTFIDDAYNSNPIGFAAALPVLDTLKEPGGRRILITPGMVELGAVHDEAHRKIGGIASRHVDVLLPVIPERISTLVESFRAAAPEALVILCKSFSEAREWLDKNASPKDVVLIENDLPDLYETKLSL